MQSIQDAVKSAKTQLRKIQTTDRDYSKEIAKWLVSDKCGDLNRFSKDIAGDDFDTIVKGLNEMVRTKRGLYLVGGVGCGKTLLMRHLYARFGFSQDHKRWADCADHDGYLWVLDRNQNEHGYRDEMSKNVFIDDLGMEIKTEYGRRTDFVSTFIQDYYARGERRLIISSNLTPMQLVERYDQRLVDRLVEMCVVVKLSGESHRSAIVVK